jgi:hypothetical protein
MVVSVSEGKVRSPSQLAANEQTAGNSFTHTNGIVALTVERLACNEEDVSSNLTGSTLADRLGGQQQAVDRS